MHTSYPLLFPNEIVSVICVVAILSSKHIHTSCDTVAFQSLNVSVVAGPFLDDMHQRYMSDIIVLFFGNPNCLPVS